MTKIALEITLSAEDRKAIIDEVTAKLKSVAESVVKNTTKTGTTSAATYATADHY
jgi:hypothetical protein